MSKLPFYYGGQGMTVFIVIAVVFVAFFLMTRTLVALVRLVLALVGLAISALEYLLVLASSRTNRH